MIKGIKQWWCGIRGHRWRYLHLVATTHIVIPLTRGRFYPTQIAYCEKCEKTKCDGVRYYGYAPSKEAWEKVDKERRR